MTEWTYVYTEERERFCRIEQFGLSKRQGEEDIEFVITVREYIDPPDPAMRFLAQTDKQTNQKTAPFTPVGWGPILSTALSECVKAIRRFPYEPQELPIP